MKTLLKSFAVLLFCDLFFPVTEAQSYFDTHVENKYVKQNTYIGMMPDTTISEISLS